MNKEYRVLRDPDNGRWLVARVIASYTGKRGATRHVDELNKAADAQRESIPMWHDSEDRDRGAEPDYYLKVDE